MMNKMIQIIVCSLLVCIAYGTLSASSKLDKAESAARLAMDSVSCREKCPAYNEYDYEKHKIPDNTARDKCIASCEAVLLNEWKNILK